MQSELMSDKSGSFNIRIRIHEGNDETFANIHCKELNVASILYKVIHLYTNKSLKDKTNKPVRKASTYVPGTQLTHIFKDSYFRWCR